MDLSFYFKSASHVRILRSLIAVERELCFRDIVDASDVSISSAQSVLRYFLGIKLIKKKCAGQEVRYKLLDTHEDLDILRTIFRLERSEEKREGKVHPGGLKVIRAIDAANKMVAKVRNNA